MKLRDYFSLKHILFAIFIMALMMVFAINQSNNMVKVNFQETSIRITSSKYAMTIQYSDIDSIELDKLVAPGEKGNQDAYDDNLVRTGFWVNDHWGEYHICADPDTSNCIVVHLSDGQTYVFSRKNDSETADIYNTLLTYIQP